MNKETVTTVVAAAALTVITVNAVVSLVDAAKLVRKESKIKKAIKEGNKVTTS